MPAPSRKPLWIRKCRHTRIGNHAIVALVSFVAVWMGWSKRSRNDSCVASQRSRSVSSSRAACSAAVRASGALLAALFWLTVTG